MKPIQIDVGTKFNRLTVMREVARGRRAGKSVRRFLCRCDCGREVEVLLTDLRVGDTQSCGCLLRENQLRARPPLMVTHGLSRHDGTKIPEYCIWQAMKDRCLNPRHKFYSYYGGRGITVFPGWVNDFVAFLEHIGRRPSPKLQIDRIDNNRGYEPGNVRWATKAEQMANRRPYKKRSVAA